MNYELLRRLYPEWFSPNPFHPILQVFLAIAILLIVPYIYSKFIEGRLAAILKKIRPPRPHLDQLFSA